MEVKEELREIILEKIRRGEELFKEIYGQDNAKIQIISSLISGRNILIIGPPGVGKTTIAKEIAKLLPPLKFPEGIPRWAFPEFPFTTEEYLKRWEEGPYKELKGIDRFVRIQGSPDLEPEDLIGDLDPTLALKYGPYSPKAFSPGKIFLAHKGVLFFDEINRAPPKIQNVLLQVLEERKVTLGPYTIDLPLDFILIATMNPEDFAGTERLSEVFLDRFDVAFMTYPENENIEMKIVKDKGIKLIEVPEEYLRLIVRFIRYLRELEEIERKPSVRATIGIYEKAQAIAVIKGKKSIEISDIIEASLSVLPSRIRLKPSIRYTKDVKDFLREEFDKFLKKNTFFR